MTITTLWLILDALMAAYLILYCAWVHTARRDKLMADNRRIRSIEKEAPPFRAAVPGQEVSRAEQTLTIRAQEPPNVSPSIINGDGLQLVFAKHIGARREQQDCVRAAIAHIGARERAIAVLCDGMGGMQGGARASAIATNILFTRIEKCAEARELTAATVSALRACDGEVAALCDDNGVELRSGTTAVTAVVEGGHLFWSCVGDSRVYLLRGNKLAQLSRDHNYYMELQKRVAAGEITAQEAQTDRKREALISYVGIGNLSLIDHNGSGSPLQPGDLILLCSDGLYKSLTDEQISRVSQDFAQDLEKMAAELVGQALSAGGGRQDNTTIAIIRVK